MWKFNQSAKNKFSRKQMPKRGSLVFSMLFALAGLGSTLWISTPARAQTATRANSTRVDVTLNRQPNEGYETLIGRAETAARNAVSRAFNENPSARKVSVTILGQNAGEIAPVLSLDVDRQSWASSRNVERLATYFPNSRSLLGFGTPGSPNNNFANQPQPTNAATAGQTLPNGVRVLPNGTVITGNGVQVLPNGTVVTNNGVTQVLPNGNVVSGNGAVQGVPSNPNFVPGTAARQVNNVGQFNRVNPGVNNVNVPGNVGVGGFTTPIIPTQGVSTGNGVLTPGVGTGVVTPNSGFGTGVVTPNTGFGTGAVTPNSGFTNSVPNSPNSGFTNSVPVPTPGLGGVNGTTGVGVNGTTGVGVNGTNGVAPF